MLPSLRLKYLHRSFLQRIYFRFNFYLQTVSGSYNYRYISISMKIQKAWAMHGSISSIFWFHYAFDIAHSWAKMIFFWSNNHPFRPHFTPLFSFFQLNMCVIYFARVNFLHIVVLCDFSSWCWWGIAFRGTNFLRYTGIFLFYRQLSLFFWLLVDFCRR